VRLGRTSTSKMGGVNQVCLGLSGTTIHWSSVNLVADGHRHREDADAEVEWLVSTV
jgi:hypothetical protein